jgi:hypothetical protein
MPCVRLGRQSSTRNALPFSVMAVRAKPAGELPWGHDTASERRERPRIPRRSNALDLKLLQLA